MVRGLSAHREWSFAFSGTEHALLALSLFMAMITLVLFIRLLWASDSASEAKARAEKADAERIHLMAVVEDQHKELDKTKTQLRQSRKTEAEWMNRAVLNSSEANDYQQQLARSKDERSTVERQLKTAYQDSVAKIQSTASMAVRKISKMLLHSEESRTSLSLSLQERQWEYQAITAALESSEENVRDLQQAFENLREENKTQLEETTMKASLETSTLKDKNRQLEKALKLKDKELDELRFKLDKRDSTVLVNKECQTNIVPASLPQAKRAVTMVSVQCETDDVPVPKELLEKKSAEVRDLQMALEVKERRGDEALAKLEQAEIL
ncbi:hypothetical protein HDU96_004482, partial [Phlyctochytrium bullatum]